mgnify:CR=1 FL=1
MNMAAKEMFEQKNVGYLSKNEHSSVTPIQELVTNVCLTKEK